MSKPIKWILKGSAVVVITIIGFISWTLYPKLSNMKSEYITAGVIRDLDAYIVAHPQQWPKSWKDLGDGSDHSTYTRFRFDLSTELVLMQPDLIYEAATPVSGQYYTYPHAKSQLEDVLKKMKEQNEISTSN